MSSLDDKVAALAARHLPLAARILAEAIRIPADYVDKPVEEGGDPLCGLSNHEGPRMEYLKRTVVEVGAVRRPEDVGFDDYGNLVWSVQDETDAVPARDKKVVYLDGHADTVKALRPQWREKTNGGIDAYDGLVDLARVDRSALRGLLGYLPPDGEWEHLLFGRGSADQLAGVVSQIVATKILLELAARGRAARRHRALVRHRRRGGQRRRRPAAPDGPRPARRAGRARSRRRDPHRGHGRLEEGRPRHLPRPARADADRGRGDRPLLPRLDAVGGPQPARARRRDRGRGRAALRRARGLPRPPLPRPRHAHRLVGEARHAERLRGPRAAHVPLRPAAHDRRDAGAGRARRRGARRGAGGASGGAAGGGDGPALPGEDLARLPGRQPPDLPGLAHARGAPRDPRGGRGLSRGRDAPRRGGAGRSERGRAAARAARRPLDLLDRRRRLPHPREATLRSPCPRRSAGSCPGT